VVVEGKKREELLIVVYQERFSLSQILGFGFNWHILLLGYLKRKIK
jgi:hypothetical protein